MATFNSAQYLLQKEARVNTSRLATENVASGEVEFAVIPYTLAGTEDENSGSADDIINLCLLPAGCIPLPQLSSITCSADPGTTLTLDVGTANNSDGWFDDVDIKGGGQVNACDASLGTIPAWLAPTDLVADTGSQNAVVYATVKNAASLNAAVILYFTLAFKRHR